MQVSQIKKHQQVTSLEGKATCHALSLRSRSCRLQDMQGLPRIGVAIVGGANRCRSFDHGQNGADIMVLVMMVQNGLWRGFPVCHSRFVWHDKAILAQNLLDYGEEQTGGCLHWTRAWSPLVLPHRGGDSSKRAFSASRRLRAGLRRRGASAKFFLQPRQPWHCWEWQSNDGKAHCCKSVPSMDRASTGHRVGGPRRLGKTRERRSSFPRLRSHQSGSDRALDPTERYG
mmetsp:Transcript_17443/g.38045  ORF Transcript_17443/g.38045 Transcript_17443/m.38045 type:complete len:229 (+) Transcript_17443:333-1019(+)